MFSCIIFIHLVYFLLLTIFIFYNLIASQNYVRFFYYFFMLCK